MRIALSGFTKEGSTAEAMWCVLGPGPDWMPATHSLVAAMAGDVKAAAAILQIVRARVPLNGLEPAGEGFGVKSGTPQTVVMHPTR